MMKKGKRKVIKSQGGMIEMKVYERLIADELKVLVILQMRRFLHPLDNHSAFSISTDIERNYSKMICSLVHNNFSVCEQFFLHRYPLHLAIFLASYFYYVY